MKTIFRLCLFLVFTANTFAQTKPKREPAATRKWVREYVAGEIAKLKGPIITPPDDARPDCRTGLDLMSVAATNTKVSFVFQATDAFSLHYTITQNGNTINSGSVKPTSATIELPVSLATGVYQLQISNPACKSDPAKGRRSFEVGAANPPRSGAVELAPIANPLAPKTMLTGNYEIRYVESRPDNHLNLQLAQRNGELYISDIGSSLQSATYVFNHWTDLEGANRLQDEPVQPYTLYHLSKASASVPTFREWWRTMWDSPKAEARRSELFFYIVPTSETWNPAGESNNPIGRPRAFAELPAFVLNNRKWGYEYEFKDESPERLDQLSIQFNRPNKANHLKIYSHSLYAFLKSKGYDRERRGFETLTEEECVEYANSLPIAEIVAFDIEPSASSTWIIDYDHPNYNRNLAIVINRLKERGAKAYDWMHDQPNELVFGNTILSTRGAFGTGQKDAQAFKEAYAKIGEVQRKYNPYSVISTGYGYQPYDYRFDDDDDGTQNTSPQTVYLKALDNNELWRRVYPDKDICYFVWPFVETDIATFPPNHIVNIPKYNAIARRTDNKPLYAPTLWGDNVTLGLLTSNYLFYWSPGPLSWNAAGVSAYNSTYTSGWHVWAYEQGKTPQTGNFYVGKENLAIGETLYGVYRFAQIQKAADGKRLAPAYIYKRLAKDGSTPAPVSVSSIEDGSWFVQSHLYKQPFCLVLENGPHRVLLFQDVWARPGRGTEFEVSYNANTYTGKTEGNRLFVAVL